MARACLAVIAIACLRNSCAENHPNRRLALVSVSRSARDWSKHTAAKSGLKACPEKERLSSFPFRERSSNRMTGKRILVVDDEAPIRRALRIALTGHGYNVETAADGED